jgi:hypothetical protein
LTDYQGTTVYRHKGISAGVYISPVGEVNSEGKNFYFPDRATNSYFNIRSSNGNTLMDIANNGYYLQSDNMNTHSGSYFDLGQGVIDIRSKDG